MKVGTDGVLLGSWADVSSARNVLDVGTGSGLIALMLAQRSSGRVTAIDIVGEAAAQARDNFRASPFAHRLTAIHDNVLTHDFGQPFDLIVSNPPFFHRSLKNPSADRATARHTDTLPFDQLIARAASLLSDRGSLALIVPAEQVETIDRLAAPQPLFPSRRTYVSPREDLPPKRALLQYVRHPVQCRTEQFFIEHERHHYSDTFLQLTRAFYL